MSPKNEVLPLGFVALKCVSGLLVQCLSDDEGACFDAVEAYLLDATGEVLQDLLKTILNAENLDAATRFCCLRTILREDVKRLDTGLFPHSYYLDILEVIAVKGVGLNHLNLKGIWLREYPHLLVDILDKLKNLRVLIIPHMPDDAVLEAISACGQLTVLDISGECNFTQCGLGLLKANKLRVLSIGMFGKKNICDRHDGGDIEIIAALITSIRTLSAVKTFSYTGEALLRVHGADATYSSNLKYIHDTNTSGETLEAIAATCPDLESVNFNAPLAGVLAEAHRLKNVNSLKVSEAATAELLAYLQAGGGRLQTLKLNLMRGDTVDVSQICTLAPELTALEIYKSRLICLNPDTYFMNLQTIEVLYCDVGDAVLRYLLQNTPYLRRIVVGDVIRMTDGDVFRLCAECDFHCLEELWFSCARGLTVTSVELLMGHCPNLRVLGQLTGWDVSVNDLDYLKAVILSSNTDLTLLPLESSY